MIVAPVAMLALACPRAVVAQTVAPLKGQSQAQMNTDMAECSSIAQQSSGGASQPSSAPPAAGGRMRGAAAGAAAGAAHAELKAQRNHGEAYDRLPDNAKQEYRQDQARDAAAAGAVVGGSRQRRQRRQHAAQQNAAASSYDQAYKSCLMGRGYNVQ
jgi:hypothetical protein